MPTNQGGGGGDASVSYFGATLLLLLLLFYSPHVPVASSDAMLPVCASHIPPHTSAMVSWGWSSDGLRFSWTAIALGWQLAWP